MPDTIIPPPDEHSEVLDIKKVYSSTLKKKSKILALVVSLSILWILAVLFFLPREVAFSQVGIYLSALPLFIISGWLSKIYLRIRESFWKQLALKYKWEYTATKNIANEKALLFQIGHSRRVQYGIAGSYNNQPFHIFEYQYSTGNGKNKSTYSLTVFEIKFSGTFPHLYLNYKNDGYSNIPFMFSTLATIPVPGEFEKKFTLYAPKEYEIETLEIFTPDIFALLIDLKWNHDMEFIDGELVIYRKAKFDNFVDLEAELIKVRKFIDILSPRLNRLKLAQIGDLSPLLEA